jgi:hypothetical protein
VLLNHVTGSQSFQDLKTVDGVLCDNFPQAAERRGLIEADNTLDQCLTESAQWAMPVSLRRLFATILVFCEASDIRGLWDRHLEDMSDDFRQRHTCPTMVEQEVLLDIRGMLQSMGKDIKSFPLPDIDDNYDNMEGEVREVIEEMAMSGVAASIMPGGRTAHSKFKIPLNIDAEGSSCNFTKQCGTAKLTTLCFSENALFSTNFPCRYAAVGC